MFKKLPTILVALLILVVILLMMCAFQVRFTEAAVVTRLDKVKKVIGPSEAGFHWKYPWPIDRVHRYDARLRSFETEFRQIGTSDQKTVILTAYAQWRISDARRFLESVGREDAAAKKIRDLLENQVSIVLRTHPLSQLVNTDPQQMQFSEIEHAFLTGIQGPANDNYGIQVVSVGIKRLGLPESVTREVFSRMKEDRQREIKELTAEGESIAKQIRSDAEEKSKRIMARAEAYAKTIEGQGDAQAATYYEVFARNPQLSDFLKKLETVQRIFEAGQITLVLDAAKIAPFDLIREATKTHATASDMVAKEPAAASEPPKQTSTPEKK
ncbi:MAG TPA: protease modulator HflC [Phycisphaerae bacterium]|nr:protease modulator HflC [Phycisphaerae bacterium]